MKRLRKEGSSTLKVLPENVLWQSEENHKKSQCRYRVSKPASNPGTPEYRAGLLRVTARK
jgi:hypothetical protein